MSSADPITEFLNAIERAAHRQIDTAPAALATADASGRPSVRMVLLRGVDDRGFVIYTNYNSRKARELVENPHAALCIHWHSLEEQIRIEGPVERLSSAESDAYFDTRPRGSQLGAWASNQIAVLASRETHDHEYREIERRYVGQS
ncbi:MAG: pyridoxal 5'-phosphate synthase [Vicinamibacterales bacterium]